MLLILAIWIQQKQNIKEYLTNLQKRLKNRNLKILLAQSIIQFIYVFYESLSLIVFYEIFLRYQN